MAVKNSNGIVIAQVERSLDEEETKDAAKDVTGQIFGVRMNEIFLFGQHRPVRSVHRGEGWTPETIAEHGMPALKASFSQLDRSADVFTWDPI
jgi:hypothetical protein